GRGRTPRPGRGHRGGRGGFLAGRGGTGSAQGHRYPRGRHRGRHPRPGPRWRGRRLAQDEALVVLFPRQLDDAGFVQDPNQFLNIVYVHRVTGLLMRLRSSFPRALAPIPSGFWGTHSSSLLVAVGNLLPPVTGPNSRPRWRCARGRRPRPAPPVRRCGSPPVRPAPLPPPRSRSHPARPPPRRGTPPPAACTPAPLPAPGPPASPA